MRGCSVTGCLLSRPRIPAAGKHDLFSLRRPGEHFYVFASVRPVRIVRRLALAIFDDLDQFQLTDLLHGLTRNHQYLLFLQGNQDTSEHAGIDARRARPCNFHLKAAASRLCFGYNLADCPAALFVKPLDLYADALADLEAASQGFTNAGYKLHVFRIKERDQHLARRNHVADIDLLVDDGSVDGRTDGGPIQRGLHFIDGRLGAVKVRLGGLQRCDSLSYCCWLIVLDFTSWAYRFSSPAAWR